MAHPEKRVPLSGSEHPSHPGARAVGRADPQERIVVTVKLRSRAAAVVHATLGAPLGRRQHLARSAFAASHGADPAELRRVEEFARTRGLEVVESSIAKRRVRVAGTASALAAAFDVNLAEYETPALTYRGRASAIHLPADLAPVVEAVVGFSNRPIARPHFQRRKGTAQPRAGAQPMTPVEVAKLYDFPDGDGSGQCIGIIELGGGFRTEDLQAYFSGLGLPTPEVVAVPVLGGQNNPGDDADGEVMLDIEVAGAVAPKARIAVYFAPNTDQGFLAALTDAMHDDVNRPSVISISWGSPEARWSTQAMQAFNNAMRDAAALGVTVCVASGDNGSSDGETDGRAHVDFPASGTYALGCGGTRLAGTGGTITDELVWNDDPTQSATGGGISDVFDLPSYQENASIPPSVNAGARVGRGVPDIAGNADPVTGYRVRVDGQDTVIGGTSAVAPLWAGLIALLNQRLGNPVGFLNPLLYGQLTTAEALHDITGGNNGDYEARPGWDACTGLGSPDGNKLLSALSPQPAPAPAAAPARTGS
jgi:kumamolisin